jgi:His-Xaa-Ser system radical SAM maturase HxsC
MAITLRTRGDLKSEEARFSARVTFSDVSGLDKRADYVRVISVPGAAFEGDDLQGYAGIIVTKDTLPQRLGSANARVISVPSIDHLSEGHIVSVEPKTGMVLTVFRPESRHNVIFTTDRCNSNCLMCSQPPKDVDDSWRIREHLRLLSLIETSPQFLCITGGEPTLLGDELIRLLDEIKSKLPETSVQMLTNGRSYANAGFAGKIAAVRHPRFISAIPLYADIAGIHDYIVQAPGAFDETVEGLYNAAEAGLKVEIRVVLHKQSIPRLVELAEFIYRNFPFAAHIAFMGMEHMGYVKKNWELLWIDPVQYMPELEAAVRHLWQRRMNVSIYNLQLCLLPQSLWAFARRSISDFKNEYVEECDGCSQREHCSGLFSSQLRRYSAHLRRL